MSWSEFSDGRHILGVGAITPDLAQGVTEECFRKLGAPMSGYRACQLPHLCDELHGSFEAELQRKPSIEIGLPRGLQSFPQFHGELSPSADADVVSPQYTSEEAGARIRGRDHGSRRRSSSLQAKG